MLQDLPPFRVVPLAVCFALLSGCGDGLRTRIAELEGQLTKEKAALASANADLLKERAALVSLREELTKERRVKAEEVERAEAEKRAAADRKSVVTVQLGLTMKSGDTKPVVNAKVYLTRRRVIELWGNAPVTYNDGQIVSRSPVVAWAMGEGDRSVLYSKAASRVRALVAGDSVVTSDTDFNGTAVFEDVPKGDYYVICATTLGGGAVLEKRVSINSAKVKSVLSNSDIVE